MELSKKQKVLEYIKENPKATATQVAEATGTYRQYVHSVIYLERKRTGLIKKKPKKVEAPSVNVKELEKKIQVLELDVNEFEKTLSEQDKIIANLRKHTKSLEIIIAYLEMKLGGVKNGPTV